MPNILVASEYNNLIQPLIKKKNELRISNTELSTVTGISEKTIGGLLNGAKQDVKLSTIIQLAKALSCSILIEEL